MVEYFRERRMVFLLGFALLMLTSLPYLIGYETQGEAWRFSGFVFGVEDGNSYIAKMLMGANGDWLFRTPYSSKPQTGFLTFLPYLLLGKLTTPPGQHEQLVALYHFFRWASGMMMVVASFDFVSLFIQSQCKRLFATALIIAGGGFGWLSIIGLDIFRIERIPLEFYSPETFGFLSFFGIPHLGLSRALMLWGLVLLFKRESGIRAGIIWLILSFVQPLTVLTGWFLLAVYCIILYLLSLREHGKFSFIFARTFALEIRQVFYMLGVSSPLILYTFWTLQRDPFLSRWAEQNILSSPPVSDYLLSFGLLVPFLAAGVWKVLQGVLSRKLDRFYLMLPAWIVSFPLLAYFPHNVQRRLPDGIWVAVIILTMIGIPVLTGKLQKWFWGGLVLTFISSTLILAGGVMASLLTTPPVFQPTPQVKAFLFLASKAEERSVVLSSYESGNAIPAWAPVQVVIGHGPETVYLEKIKPLVSSFYSMEMKGVADRKRFLEEYGVRFVLYGPNERALGDWDPSIDLGILNKIYDQDGYQAFQTVESASSSRSP
ncbi:MAG: hypothetical protein IT308_02930 [Anaerolineaceae bacterium]|nr:hypothetical protein [Anaerolineaceae bacterium]